MCLEFSEYNTKTLKVVGPKIRTCFKMVCEYIDGSIRSQFYDYEWKIGENKSNRDDVNLTRIEVISDKINQGIHVYLRRPDLDLPTEFDLKDNLGNYRIIVIEVECDIDNLVGVNSLFTEAVFTKVNFKG